MVFFIPFPSFTAHGVGDFGEYDFLILGEKMMIGFVKKRLKIRFHLFIVIFFISMCA